MARIDEKIILKLPKTDLHCHLDGSMRIESILDMAKQDSVSLPFNSIKELKNILVPGPECESLEKYLDAFKVTVSVLQTEQSLKRAAYELIFDASKENIRYIEVRFCPLLHTEKGLTLEKIVESVLSGLREGGKKHNVKTGLIICGLKQLSLAKARELAHLAVSYKTKGVIGFDMAGPEENFPNVDYWDAFKIILKNNINVTTHAGEAYGPESIHQAIHYCGAHRIGHGATLREDPDLMNYVNDHRIPLEICITSNVQTKAVKSIQSHPVKDYFDAGLRVTINTDNRLMSDTTITKELMLCANEFDFSLLDIKRLIVNGFKSAFMPNKKRAEMILKVIEEIQPY